MESTPIPPELVCPICNCLLEDAVMMPCCAGTACEPCARAGSGTCPVCGEVATTEELIPYRLFRDKVDKFCSQTGYARARPPQHHPQPSRPPKPSLPDIVLPTLQSHRPPGSSVTDSPRGTSPPRPQTPTPSPPKSPGTPLSYPERRSGSPVTPHSHHNKAHGRGTPTTSPEFISNPKPPGPTLLPPVHVLAPSSHWPPSSPHPSALVQVTPTFLHPTEDPLAAFEAAMRKLDSKKASRGRHDPASPPRAYREERTRTRSRERLRDHRERDNSSRRKSPGGYRNCSPRGREGVPPRGSSYLAEFPNVQTDSRSNFRSEGKIRDVQEDYVELAWSRPRRERYVTDIPPETQEERRDRERFERNLAKRETGSHRSRSEIKGSTAYSLEYQERKGTENKDQDVDSRTPSLSPEPEGKYEFGRRGEVGKGYREDTEEMKYKKDVTKVKMREKRDKENCGTKFKNEEEYTRSINQDCKNLEVSKSDRSYDRRGERELSSCEEHCEENAKYMDEEHQGGMIKPRNGEEMQDGKRSSGEELVSEGKGKLTAEHEKEDTIKGDVEREIINENEGKVHASRKRLEENKILKLNAAAKQRSGEVEQENASSVVKEFKKVKKSKKSKKNKVKDKELRKSNKESRKRKKHKKRGNDIDEELPEEDVKSLVPYDEAEDTKTEDSSAENQEDNHSSTSNFISSFKETKIECRRGRLDLPSLVVNFKAEDLAQKKVHSKDREKAILAKLQLYSESLSSSRSKEVKGHSKDIEMEDKNNVSDVQACGSPEMHAAPNVSSKWEREDILTAEYPELKHPLVTDPESVTELPKLSVQGSSSGPQNVLRKALANMEKDHLLREKKQRSLEGTKSTKKKKKTKKKKSRGGNDTSEDESRLKKKKRKKKKSGIEIPEKTLKKLLKKNLIRKEALEKMISKEGEKKKRKKKYSDAEKGKGRTRQSSSEEEIDKKHVNVSKVRCQEGETEEERSTRRKEGSEERKGHMSGNKRGSSEEGREVKASREGKIQVRLAIRESSALIPGKKSLASTVQANLLKMASQDSSVRGERGRRGSPERRSVKDRLGPARREHSSPVRRSSLRENDRSSYKLDDDKLTRFEGRKTFGRVREDSVDEDRLDVWESGGLEPVPAKLQAWAGRHSPVRQDRDNRRRREKDSSVEESCKERRRKHGNH